MCKGRTCSRLYRRERLNGHRDDCHDILSPLQSVHRSLVCDLTCLGLKTVHSIVDGELLGCVPASVIQSTTASKLSTVMMERRLTHSEHVSKTRIVRIFRQRSTKNLTISVLVACWMNSLVFDEDIRKDRAADALYRDVLSLKVCGKRLQDEQCPFIVTRVIAFDEKYLCGFS